MGFRHKFAYSFSNFTAYKEFLLQGLGKSIFYIFLVTLIFSTIANLKTIYTLNSQISDVQATFLQSSPQFELKNGILSVDSSQPIYYKHDDEVLIVDTNDTTNSSVLNAYENGIFMNSEEVILRQNYTTMQTISFKDWDDLIVTNKTVQNMLSISKILIPIFLLILNPIFSFIECLVSVFLLLGPLCISISSIMGVKLNYSKSCTLSFYAMTLPLLLESLLSVAGIVIPEFSAIFYIVTLIYCGLAIKEIKNTDKSNLNYMK